MAVNDKLLTLSSYLSCGRLIYHIRLKKFLDYLDVVKHWSKEKQVSFATSKLRFNVSEWQDQLPHSKFDPGKYKIQSWNHIKRILLSNLSLLIIVWCNKVHD